MQNRNGLKGRRLIGLVFIFITINWFLYGCAGKKITIDENQINIKTDEGWIPSEDKWKSKD